jgi:GT2 family glycosyltransferase
MKRLSVIIVNFNTKDILRDCLINLSGKYENKEVIVVDNNSGDGSYDMLKLEFPWVVSIRSENKGLAHGYNLGVEASSGEYLLFLGTDSFPGDGVLEKMVDYMEFNGLVGASTPKLVLQSGKVDFDSHRGFPTPWVSFTHFSGLERLFPKSKLFGGYFLGYEDLTVEHEIDLCIAHFMLVKRKVINMVGPWDESFFVYGEDVDFCYRIKESGWKIMYLPQFVVTHLKGVSVGVRKETKSITKASPEVRNSMRIASVDAMKLFYKKHMEKKYSKLINSLVYLGISLLKRLRSS